MATLSIADALKYKAVFICGVAKYSEQISNSLQFGIGCLDQRGEFKKVSAYLWLVNSECDLSDKLICNIESLYNQLTNSVYSCLAAADTCEGSVIYQCANFVLKDITPATSIEPLSIDAITILI